VLEARDGVEALAAAESHGTRFDLLATDVDMPRLSGTELARRLTLRRPELRVLFFSGSSQEQLDGPDSGVADSRFLQKPFSEEALFAALRALLGAAGGPPSARRPVVVLQMGERRTGIVVDGMLGQHEIVVKGFDAPQGTLPVFSGATIMGDGVPALILDAGGLV